MRGGTQGYQLRLETAASTGSSWVDFLLLALSYEKLEEIGEEEWGHEWGWGEARTELASPQHC